MLDYVKTKRCPICGCQEVTREEIATMDGKISYHCNETRMETRGFSCGYTVRFIPNFEKEIAVGKCKKTREQEVGEYNSTIDKLISCLEKIESTKEIKIKIKEILEQKKHN